MKLPIIGTLQEALQMVAAHRRDLLRVGLVFIIGFFALGIVFLRYLLPMFPEMMGDGAAGSQPTVDPRLPFAVLIMFVIEILLFTVFAVGWHRAVLIGAERGQGAQLGGRELRYFWRFWRCIAISIATMIALAFVEQFIGAALHADAQLMTIGAELSYLLVIGYVFARLGPSFAALSVDQAMNFRESWIVTKGNGARVLLMYAIVGAGGLVLNILLGIILNMLGLGEIAPYTVMLIGALTFCALIAVIVSINAIVFRRLTGWQTPATTTA